MRSKKMTFLLRVSCLFLSLGGLFDACLAASSATAFFSPLVGGGSMLDNSGYGQGEPLNVIISGQSSPDVLTDDGFLNFARSIGFSTECLGFHLGDPFPANLGDGNGWVNQTVELRQDYGSPFLGTCLESAAGGNHFRVFRQNGPLANSQALFLAVSWEEDVSKKHTVSPNGYDVGRDSLVKAATSGLTSFGDITYSTTSTDIPGLLPTGTANVNHGIAFDGIVKLLTVNIV